MNEQNYSQGVGVFIIQDNKLLLTYRIKGDQTGVWEVIAGHIEEGELPAETAVREALEESGLQIKITRQLGVNIDHQFKFHSTMLLAEVVEGVPQNIDTRNHSQLAWFDLNALPQPLGTTTVKGLNSL